MKQTKRPPFDFLDGLLFLFNGKNVLTNAIKRDNMLERRKYAGVAQLVEQLICNQQVGGSNPSTSSIFFASYTTE